MPWSLPHANTKFPPQRLRFLPCFPLLARDDIKTCFDIVDADGGSGGSDDMISDVLWQPGFKQEIRHFVSHFSERAMRLRCVARIGLMEERMEAKAAQLTAAKHSFTISVVDSIGGALFLEAYWKQDAQT